MTAKETIEAGKAILGIEFGSTRIKAVLIDQDNKPIAQGPKEYEDTQRQQPVESHLSARRCRKRQHIDERERQGDIHLCQHGVGPVLNGVVLLQVQLGHQQVDNGHQIRYEHHALGSTAIEVAAEIGHGKEQIDGSDGRYKAVYRHMLALVDQSCKLPHGESCHNAKQQHHGLRAQETRHNSGHEDDACNGSNDKILHETPPSAPEGATFE